MIIYDDSTNEIAIPDGQSTGYQGMYCSRETMGDIATDFPQSLMMSRDEAMQMAAEQDRDKSSLYHLLLDGGWHVKNQQNTNYCWSFSPTSCIEMLRVIQGQNYVSLSPASVAGPVTGYKNVGGWGQNAMEFIADYGIVPSSLWPDTAIQKSLHTPQNVEQAKPYRTTEWMILPSNNLDAVFSCVLRRIPVSVGYGWWRHQVTAVGVKPNGDLIIANSWGESWSDNGFGILRGNKRIPDDACAPRVAVAS